MEKARFKEFEFEWPSEVFNELLEVAWSKYESLPSDKIYPSRRQVLRAFEECSFEDCRVVIVGQDPYHGEGQANGLAFSVSDGVKLPPSLKNIYKEMENCGIPVDWTSGDLSFLARKGFLLLNSSLTVEAAKPMSHSKLGWHDWTDFIIQYISKNKSGVTFLLWGKFAESKMSLIDNSKHSVIITSHPSPLSAYRGFLGSGCFNFLLDYVNNSIK